MREAPSRGPAAVSARRKIVASGEPEPVKRRFRRDSAAAPPQTAAVPSRSAAARFAPPGANAAVASSRTRQAAPQRYGPATTVPLPSPGPYAGQTDEVSPRRISFRYLGGGVRDLLIGGKLIAEWIPVSAGGAAALVGDAAVRVMWDEARRAHGSITRRRAGREETLHFHVRQRFRHYVN